MRLPFCVRLEALGSLVGLATSATSSFGCGGACPPYVERACAMCGADSPGCTDAKEIAATFAGKEAECRATAATLIAKSKSETFQRRYCNAPDSTTQPDLATLGTGPWICSGVRVTFGTQSMIVGDARHELEGWRVSQFRVRSGPAYARRKDDGAIVCRYDLGVQPWSGGEVALALDCPPGLGLPDKWTACLREG